MKTQELTDIQQILREIIGLFDLVKEEQWRSNFVSILNLSHTVDHDDSLRKFCQNILTNFGGMGSFNDLILHKNGQALIDENNRLDALKDELYESVQKVLVSSEK